MATNGTQPVTQPADEPPPETTDDHRYRDGYPYDIVEPVDDAPIPFLD